MIAKIQMYAYVCVTVCVYAQTYNLESLGFDYDYSNVNTQDG